MARLYANENFPLRVVHHLRGLGHDAITIQETGKGGQSVPDESVLEYAVAEDRAVLTINRRHFIRLHARRAGHAGIVVCSYDPDSAALAARIDAAIREAGALQGQLLRVNRPSR